MAELTRFERTRLMERCCDHEVAYCDVCRDTHYFTELGALVTDAETGEPLGCDQYEPGNHCPGCGADLTQSILDHMEECSEYSRHNSD